MPLSTDRLRGFLEATASFSVLLKRAKGPVGYQAVADFTVKLPAHEAETLHGLQAGLGAGRVYVRPREAVLKITKLEDIQNVATLLAQAPFLSAGKQREFDDWRRCIALMSAGAHRTKPGLLRIALLRDQMHARKQWNKRAFCSVRKAVDPCCIVKEDGDIRPGCRICFNDVDVPLAALTRKAERRTA